MSEVQSFKSVDEAISYIKSHEIATNNRFIKLKTRNMAISDVTSLSEHRCYFTTKSDLFSDDLVVLMSDGIPFIHLGCEERACQYGPNYHRNKKPYQDPEDSGNLPLMETPKKKRKMKPTKKVDCPARIRVKKVLKFPEYAIDPGRGMNKNVTRAMLEKLRTNFSDQTKRYIQVYVQIDHNHKHEGIQTLKRHKPKTANSAIDEGCTRVEVDQEPEEVPQTSQVLKRLATLKGRDLTNIAVQFKTTSELPRVLARPKVYQNLEDMNDNQLMLLYYDITGEVPNEMFSYANKEFTTDNLRLLLHLCIMFANAAGGEQTHPSIRIKGTENDYTPIQCTETECATMEPHMHCPFCAMTDSYIERGLLKAHYTKQHVDKALEFSGLKILRCYDVCEVASRNLDCKTFRGGHWHCYKCSSAYERRQDMVYHFSTHLKEYESSFLVHVAQDVNPSQSFSTMTHEIGNFLGSSLQQDLSAADCLETLSATKYVNGKSPLKRQYTDTGYGDGNILYVEEDELGNVLSSYTAQEVTTTGEESIVVSYTDSHDTGTAQLKSRIQELEIYCKKLEKDAILQKSLIAFLEKKNADQANIHTMEKEKLTEEIVALKGSKTIIDDTPEVGTSGVDALGDIQPADDNDLDKYGKTPVAKLLSRQKGNNVAKPEDSANVQRSKSQQLSVQQSFCNNTSCSEISDIKKDIAELKNTLYMTFGGNNRFGQTSCVQNSSQLYFIPNQGVTNPSQNVFSQNLTGLVNMNPLNVLPNTGLVNFSLGTQQTIPNTSVVNNLASSAIPQNTNTLNVSSYKIQQPSSISQANERVNTNSAETDMSSAASKTHSVNTENGSLGKTRNVNADSEKNGTSDENESDSVLSNSETANTKSLEVSEQDMEEADTRAVQSESLNAEIGYNKEESTKSALDSEAKQVSESASNEVFSEKALLVNEPEKKTETSDASSTNAERATENSGHTETITSPTEITSTVSTDTKSSGTDSKKDVSPNPEEMETKTECQKKEAGSLVTQSSKFSAKSSVNKLQDQTPSVLNIGNSSVINMPFTFGSSCGLQNSAPLIFVPNQGYMAPYVTPQNFTGLVNAPQLNPFQTLGATNSMTLSSQGVQNSAPLVFVPNLGGTSQYIIPQNDTLGVSTGLGLTTEVRKDVSLNMSKNTSDSATESTENSTEKCPSTKTAGKGQLNTEANTGSLNTETLVTGLLSSEQQSSRNQNPGSVTKETPKEGSVIRLYRTPEKASVILRTPEKMSTRSSSKSSGNTEKVIKGGMTVISKAVSPSKDTGNTNTSSTEGKKTDKKGYVVVLSAKPSSEGAAIKTTGSKGPVNTKLQVTSQNQAKTTESQKTDKKKVMVLSVKGNIDSKSLSQIFQKYKK